MPLAKPQAPPGFQSQATQVQAVGAWYGGNLVRWRNGLLERWMGWERLFPGPFAALIRRMHAWLDLDNHRNLFVATDLGLQLAVEDTIYGLGPQVLVHGGEIVEIGAADGATFSVTSGSTTVTVNTNVAMPDDVFLLLLPISIGGQILAAGTFFPIASKAAGAFTFNMPQAAVVTETTAFGLRLFNNNAVNRMQVTWKAHGLAVNSTITFAQTTTIKYGAPGKWEGINFSAPAGTVVIVDTIIDANNFSFAMGPLGTGDGSGATTRQVYDGCSSVHGTNNTFVTSLGNVIGAALSQPLGDPTRNSWFLGNLGQDGLALHSGSALQLYHPPIANGPFLTTIGAGPPATASQHNNGFIIAMPQAQVILFGTEAVMGDATTVDPLLLRWSDAGTYDVYSATVSNQAGSFRLSRGSRIVGAIQAPQATLLF